MGAVTGSRRERYRQQTRDEAKRVALRQLAEEGTLSLNAIAREMGMTGPALFRYVTSRDELLTDLVIDAYNDFADALWASVERTAGQPPEDRLRDQAAAYRAWALENAPRYLLLFGNPIPGYRAPVERTKPAAQRSFDALLALLLEIAPTQRPATADRYERELETWIDGAGGPPLPGSLIKQAFFGWTRLHGVLALEMVGQFDYGLPDPALLYAAEVDGLVRLLGESLSDPARET